MSYMRKCVRFVIPFVLVLFFFQVINVAILKPILQGMINFRNASFVPPRHYNRTAVIVKSIQNGLHFASGGLPLHNLPYLNKNEGFCSQKNMKYLVYVFTAPANFEHRQNIRRTWGNNALFKNQTGKVVFLLGNVIKKDVQNKIKEEIKLNRDIVQEDYIESYFNITFKGILALRWLNDNCKNVKYVIKLDDDNFLNIFKAIELMSVLDKKNPTDVSRSFYCVRHRNGDLVNRYPKHKWYVSEKQYKPKRYPMYCDGPVLMYTRDMVGELYNASFHVPFIPIEDAYTTGLLPNKIGGVRFNQNFGGGWKHSSFYKNRHVPLPMSGPAAMKDYVGLWRVILERLTPEQRKLLNEKALKAS